MKNIKNSKASIDVNSGTNNNEEDKNRVLTDDDFTDEQKDIIKTLKTNNVIVQAVAGSGKTTTALAFAKQNNNKQCLILTYNKRLQEDTEKRINKEFEEANGKKPIVLTIHSFANSIYRTIHPKSKKDPIKSDNGIKDELLRENAIQEIKIDRWKLLDLAKLDYLIIDEAQDLTPEMFIFIYKFVIKNSKTNPNLKILVVGDSKQNIYDTFTQSSSYFINYFGKFVKLPFEQMNLTHNFRSHTRILECINDVWLNTKEDEKRKFNLSSEKTTPPHYNKMKNKEYFLNYMI